MGDISGKGNKFEFDPNVTTDTKEDNQIPVLNAVEGPNSESSQTVFSAGTIDETMFSPEERAEIDKIASGIDIEDVNQIITFGSSAQKKHL